MMVSLPSRPPGTRETLLISGCSLPGFFIAIFSSCLMSTIGWSQRGNPMLTYCGHTYSLIKKKQKRKASLPPDPNRRIWRCSTHHSRGCTSRVHTWGTDIIYSTKHNHDDNLLELYQLFPMANFVPTRKGSQLLVHDGYAFRLKNKLAYGKKQWYCTARTKTGCLVDITTVVNHAGTVIQRVREVHNHQPPGFYRRYDGSFKIV